MTATYLGILSSCPLLPCIDDWQKLSVIADWCEDRGHVDLAKHLRWLVHEWCSNRGLQRRDVEEGMLVWARFSGHGWSRAIAQRVTARRIWLTFPHRPRGLTGIPLGERAWWDLEPRQEWNGRHWEKPKKRGGYCTGRNAALASALCFVAPVPKPEPTVLFMPSV